MPDMNDTIHCRCSHSFKVFMQQAAQKAGLSDGDYIRKAITMLNQQVQNSGDDQNERPAISNPEPAE